MRWLILSAMSSHPTRTGPIPDSYWLIDGMLLAGEYSGTHRESVTREKLTKFLDAGIRTFIDLTEATEPLAKYDGLLRDFPRSARSRPGTSGTA